MIHWNNYPIKFRTIGPLCSKGWGVQIIGEGEQIKGWGEDHRPRLFCAASKWILLKTDKLGNVCCTGNHVTRPSHGNEGGEEGLQVRKRPNESTLSTTVVLQNLSARPLVSHSSSSMEHKCSSPCLQQCTIRRYSLQSHTKSSRVLTTCFFKVDFHITLASAQNSPQLFCSLGSSD